MPVVINEVPIRVEPGPGRPSTATAQAQVNGASSVSPRPAPEIPTAVPTERWHGVFSALVLENRDPNSLGRVLVRLTWAPDAGGLVGIEKGQSYDAWARVATMSAGKNHGSWFMPDIGDEVLVSFEAGHPSRPVVLGALWNGVDTPPEATDAQNTIKTLRTRGGSEVRFDDASGEESVEIHTANGQLIRIDSGAGGGVEISDGNGNSVIMGSGGLSLTSPSAVSISGATITLEAGMVRIDSGMVRCSGVLQSDVLIANSVVAASYTPGAGNVW